MFFARQGIEVSSFNLVDEFYRFTLGRDQVKPAPRHHQACRQTQHAVSDRIAMMMVVEQPRVNVAFAQRRLDSSEVHGQTSIVNKRKDLGESGRRDNGSIGGSLPRRTRSHTKEMHANKVLRDTSCPLWFMFCLPVAN